MQPRLQTLKRLVTLYGVVEEMHSVELQRMTAAVREAQQAIGVQQQAARSARVDGRDALMADDNLKNLHPNPKFRQLVAELKRPLTGSQTQ